MEPSASLVHIVRIVACHFGESPRLFGELALKDQTFRSICEDLFLAFQALDELEKRLTTVEPQATQEYETIIEELSAEIRQLME